MTSPPVLVASGAFKGITGRLPVVPTTTYYIKLLFLKRTEACVSEVRPGQIPAAAFMHAYVTSVI